MQFIDITYINQMIFNTHAIIWGDFASKATERKRPILFTANSRDTKSKK